MSAYKFTRKRDIREPYKTIYIFTEGEKTEVNYFNSKKEEISSDIRRKNIEIVVKGTGYNTKTIVDYAIDFVNSQRININPLESNDECWVVFDKDDFKEHFDNAIIRAMANNLKVAYSNESFELWYLLHFSYFQSSVKRDIYVEKLTNLLRDLLKDKLVKYEKASQIMYELVKNKEKDAIRNAKKLLLLHKNKGAYSKKDPSTSVYLLVESLNKLKI